MIKKAIADKERALLTVHLLIVRILQAERFSELAKRPTYSKVSIVTDSLRQWHLGACSAALRPIHLNIHIEFDLGVVGKSVLTCYMSSLRNGCVEFDLGVVGKSVLTCYMSSLRNGCVEFDLGVVGKSVLTCYMSSLRNGCVEFDLGVVGKSVPTCFITSLHKWSIRSLSAFATLFQVAYQGDEVETH